MVCLVPNVRMRRTFNFFGVFGFERKKDLVSLFLGSRKNRSSRFLDDLVYSVFRRKSLAICSVKKR